MKKILSLVLKSIIIFFAIDGTVLSMIANNNSFMGGTTVLMYFTIQSNIAIAIISLLGIYYLFRKNDIPNYWYIIKFVSTLSITLTGAVFSFVLAPTMGSLAWNKVNIYTHVIVPIAAIIDFFLVCINANIKKKNVFYTIIPPIVYLIYASIGYILNWQFAPNTNYPYFFLNWGSKAGAFGITNELPFLGCFWWIVILLILILLVAYVYLLIIDLIKKYV